MSRYVNYHMLCIDPFQSDAYLYLCDDWNTFLAMLVIEASPANPDTLFHGSLLKGAVSLWKANARMFLHRRLTIIWQDKGGLDCHCLIFELLFEVR